LDLSILSLLLPSGILIIGKVHKKFRLILILIDKFLDTHHLLYIHTHSIIFDLNLIKFIDLGLFDSYFDKSSLLNKLERIIY
jgi:hypothetical protein